MSTLREKILNVKDIKTERVYVRDWDVSLDLVALTAAERIDLIAKSTVKDTDEDGKTTSRQDNGILYPLLIIASAHDPETGEKVFGDADRDTINSKSAGVIEDLGMAICRISGMTEDAQRVLAKNSVATTTDASSSV